MDWPTWSSNNVVLRGYPCEGASGGWVEAQHLVPDRVQVLQIGQLCSVGHFSTQTIHLLPTSAEDVSICGFGELHYTPCQRSGRGVMSG